MALNTNYISIKAVLSRLKGNPLMQGLSESDAATYIADCIKLVGAPMAYEDKVETIPILEYRGELPCDILYIQQTRKLADDGSTLYPMRYASDTFHSAYHIVGSPDFSEATNNYDWTYSLNNGYILTNFAEGRVQQSYKALKTDKEGFPMVPDDVKFEKAVENYIKAEWYRMQWELGKISDKVLAKAEQERDWYIGGANTRALLKSIDQAETFRGAFTRILNNNIAAKKFFQDFGRQEYIKTGRI